MDPEDTPRTINCLNAHIFNLAWESRSLAQILNESRIVAADGMSIVWTSWLFKSKLKERCNMTEVFREFAEDGTFPKSRAILVGGDEKMASAATAKINSTCLHTEVIDALSGYLTEKDYEDYFRQCEEVDFVFVGMGTPRSEELSKLISAIKPQVIVWHIGGGTILFLTDQLQEAPKWMRRNGLQWLHRLLTEPRRMWKRYLLGNILFLVRIMCFATARQHIVNYANQRCVSDERIHSD